MVLAQAYARGAKPTPNRVRKGGYCSTARRLFPDQFQIRAKMLGLNATPIIRGGVAILRQPRQRKRIGLATVWRSKLALRKPDEALSYKRLSCRFHALPSRAEPLEASIRHYEVAHLRSAVIESFEYNLVENTTRGVLHEPQVFWREHFLGHPKPSLVLRRPMETV